LVAFEGFGNRLPALTFQAVAVQIHLLDRGIVAQHLGDRRATAGPNAIAAQIN
jgi:hypothetical protein